MRRRGTIFTRKSKRLLEYVNSLSSKQRKEIIQIYSLAILFALIPITITAFTITLIPQPLFLLLIPAVSASAWYGNMKTVLLTTILSSAGIFYIAFIYFSIQMYIFSLIEFLLAVGSSVFLGFVINLAKKTKQIQIYKQRERKYADLLIGLEKEHQKAQKEIKARDEFLSIASHELKTPLTSMLLQLQTALHNIRSVSLANFSVQNLLRMIESAEGQTKRLAEMINDLLNVSLITTGRLNLTRSKFDLSDVVKELIRRFSEELKQQRYVVRLEAKTPIEGKWDKIRIEQIITNLLSNGIKYGNGKPIEISVQKNNSHVKIVFRDHGIGISHENQKRIFERFERAVGKNEYKGLGVGLYITYQIVKAHGGKITVDSTLGKGSTFTVNLPIKN